MTSHKNARTTVRQRKRIRHSRASDLVQALALGVTVAAVSKWRRRADPLGHAGRCQQAIGQSLAVRSRTVVGLAAERLAGLAAHCLPQLSRAAISRELGSRLQLPRFRLLRTHWPRPQGRFRAWGTMAVPVCDDRSCHASDDDAGCLEA